MGKYRVDKLHEYFESLQAAKSEAYKKFYSNMWDPANYGAATEASGSSAAPKMSSEKVKLHVEGPFNIQGQMI